MPTRPRSSAADTLADARHLLVLLDKHAAAFKKADAGRKARMLAPDFVTKLKASVRDATKATGAQAVARTTGKGATSVEQAKRAALFAAVTAIRDEVSLTHPDDAALIEAFGVGRRIIAHSTPSLLAAASEVIEAYADPANRKAAAAAGITPQRIKALGALHDGLASADAAQNTTKAETKGKTTVKASLLTSIKNDVAHVRKVAKVVFKGRKDVISSFASQAPRKTPKKRASKTAAKAATPAV